MSTKKISIGDLDLFIEGSENKLGIENWKKLANYGVKLHNHVKKVSEDNRFTFWEKLGSIKYLKGGWDLARLGDQLNEERKDFTASEFQEIIDIVDEGLNLGDATADYIDKFLAVLKELKEFGTMTV